MTVNERLLAVQEELKAPKGNYNSFGHYRYRSCEDILEAVKPLLKKHGATITITDEVEIIGERYYIKATATFQGTGKDVGSVSVSAYARESDSKKGMDCSQLTGTASSYARKYALNGLLLIDDTKDADTDEHHNQTHNNSNQRSKPVDPVEPEVRAEMLPTSDGKVSKAQMDLLESEMKRTGVGLETIYATYQVKALTSLSEAQVLSALRKFEKTPDKK